MEAQQTSLILLMSDNTTTWAVSLAQEFEIHVYNNVRDAARAIHNIRYNMVIIDDDLFGVKTPEIIGVLKHQFPSIPIILLNNTGVADRSMFLKAGMDAVLCKDGNEEELYYQIRMILNRSRQSYSRQRLNQQLHSLASLPRYLYSSTNQSMLLLQAINWIRHGLHLYGVTVMVKEEDKFRLYVGSEEVTNRERLYETVVHPGDCDPFLWAMRNRANQVYSNINQNPWYTSVPVLHPTGSVAILPLTHQNKTLGAIAFYARERTDITLEDLLLFEQIGSQLVAAMQNVIQQEALVLNLQFNQHLLQAWQVFSGVSSVEAIKQTLASLVADSPDVISSFVWFNTNDANAPYEIICGDTTTQTFMLDKATYNDALINEVSHYFQGSLQPILIQNTATNPRTFITLFQMMGSSQVILAPIKDSTHVLGGIVAGVEDKHNLTRHQSDFIQHLGNTAGIYLERVSLVMSVNEKNARLETLLQSISEGVFFVDEENKVTFCNPQVAELTGVYGSQAVSQDADHLLEAIAATTSNPVKIYEQLHSFKELMKERDNNEHEYPIVDISPVAQERTLDLEFVRVAGKDGKRFCWAGVLRNGTHSGRPSKYQELLLNAISDGLRLPLTQVQNVAIALSDQHGTSNFNERIRLLNQSKASFEQVGELWSSFLEIYNLEVGRISFYREESTLTDLIAQVLNRPYANMFQRQISVSIPSNLPLLNIDISRMGQSISAVIQRAFNVTGVGSTVEITAERVGQEMVLRVKDAGPSYTPDQLEEIFGPTIFSTNLFTNARLYIAFEIVAKHGGRMWAENNTDIGTSIKIALPLPPGTGPLKYKDDTAQSDLALELPPRTGNGAPTRIPNTIMFICGKSAIATTLCEKLKDQYEVLTYKSAEIALEDVSATHLDLVIIDGMLEDANSFDVCTYIRKQTQVPIILITDKATDAEKVQGLNAGADDYISKPISDGELLARIQVIFKRQHIPERISEPLTIGKLYVDFGRREVFVANQPIDLTRIEYDLFHVLIINRGSVLTHRQLLEKVWGPEYQDETHYLWVNISRLRKKLESKDKTRYIFTQPGRGYFFDVM